jgi:C-terminal processing protease CtpA/Prc
MVTEVGGDTAAASVGLQPGDVIVAINGAKIGDVNDVLAALKQTGHHGWRLSVQRGETVLTVMVGG